MNSLEKLREQTKRKTNKLQALKSWFTMVLTWTTFLKRFEPSNSIFKKSVRNQLWASLVVNIISFSHGISLGWTAPTLQQLFSDKTPLGFPITVAEGSWIASSTALGSMIGNVILCSLINKIGRKSCLLLIALPNIFLWIMIYCAQNVVHLYIGRFVGGFTGGASVVTIPLFINEISETKHRGAFQAFFIVAINAGILCGYILASNLNYFVMPFVVVLFPITFFLLLTLFPDTPQYFLKKDLDENALKSFQFYRNCTAKITICEDEFRNLKETVMASKNGKKLEIGDFLTRPALGAYGNIIILLVLNQFCGVFPFITYMSEIFVLSGAPLEPNTCTILMGITQLLGNFLTICFVDHYGRKLLIIISSIGLIAGLTAFGSYTHLKASIDMTSYTWIPLVLMTIIIFISNIGVMNIPFIIIVEILPVKIRPPMYSCSLIIFSLTVFVSLKFYPIFMHTCGISVAMWSCAVVTLVCLIYLVIFLPETKGKSVDVD